MPEETGQRRTAGWYDDPIIEGQQRRWDGIQWTNEVRQRPAATTGSQPFVSPSESDSQTDREDKGQTRLVGLIVALVGAGVGAIGCLGPWATLGVFNQGGMDVDGQLVLPILILSAILAGAALSQSRSTGLPIGAAALCGLAAVIGMIDMADVSSRSADVFGTEVKPSIGWGLWLVVLGSVSGCAGAIYAVVGGESSAPRTLREGEIRISTLRALDPPDDRSEGWKLDPLDSSRFRWWDGGQWKPKVGIRKKADQ